MTVATNVVRKLTLSMKEYKQDNCASCGHWEEEVAAVEVTLSDYDCALIVTALSMAVPLWQDVAEDEDIISADAVVVRDSLRAAAAGKDLLLRLGYSPNSGKAF